MLCIASGERLLVLQFLMSTLPSLRQHPQLYEISTLQWLSKLTHKMGRRVRLGDVPTSEWQRLRDLGFDLIYLMGVWKRSTTGRLLSRSHLPLFSRYDESLPGWALEDVAGSPFSIEGYEPDPLIGILADLESVRGQLHDLGMRLILDFVPNHTGHDHPWVREHPEYYVRGDLAAYRKAPGDFFMSEGPKDEEQVIAYGRDPNFAPWTDTAQLNYFNLELRATMIEQIRKIAQFCDGVRCDMAMLLLNDNFHQNWEPFLRGMPAPAEEFWREATRAVPDFVWIAEAYCDCEWALQQLGFQFTYDKRLYDRLRDGFVRDVYLHLKADWEFQSRSVRFLENHDEGRAASVFGNNRLPAVAVLACTIPGMHFINDGQIEGLRTQAVVQLARTREEASDAEFLNLYERILKIVDAAEFHVGGWKLIEIEDSSDHTASDLIAYLWTGEESYRLVVVNLGAGISTGRIYLPDEVLSSASLRFDDVLNKHVYERQIPDLKRWGLFIKLDGFAAHVFALPRRGC
ncbi:MAG TPA: alpha-amylase family glycosyl hydrolase [Terriglobales bacterium]|nr:alpha-amylase family glycosyl hydrolase [Terriglobales bacterium]